MCLICTATNQIHEEIDLNQCRQVKDVWGFQMTQRLAEYAKALDKASRPDFQPQIITDTGK